MRKMHRGAMLPLILLTASCAAPSPREAGTGDQLFATYCAACHGANARGTGFANEYLKVAAPDLTLIAVRRGGRFDAREIYKIIDGQSSDDFYDHRHMPAWGYEFYGDEAEDQQAHQRASDRVNSLVTYLERIQRSDPR
jgi:mono/diheme cytochrome c family protein